ncbi:MAG: ABC transporter permease [Ignavibacteriae bacterium]|nr:ABC transporter permease [Ignavibacteria bacterium]MBI3364251.1 ABC transporter permease [Ignavibacteriota bacterium]
MRDIKKVSYSVLSILAVLIVWQALSGFDFVNSHLIPPPTRVFLGIVEWAKSGELFNDFSTSIWRGLMGLLSGSAIGILLGLLTGRNHTLNLILTPLLNVFKAFPPVAMLPVFITFFGIGDFSKVFSISFATIFPLWVNTHLGSSSIPIEFIRSAKLLSKSRTKIFFEVIIPASMNSIIAGFRISIAISFIMLYVSELAGASSGLGYQISSSHLSYRMDRMFGALIVLGFTASLIDLTFNRTVKRFFPWVQLNRVM